MHCFVNKEQLPVISPYYDYKIFVILLLVLGFRLEPRQSTMFHPSCAHVKMMQRTPAIPLRAWTGPEGSRRSRLPDTLDGRNMKVTRLSALRTGRLYHPRKYSWYSYLLEAESTQGTQCGQKDYVNEKFQRHHRESILRPSG